MTRSKNRKSANGTQAGGRSPLAAGYSTKPTDPCPCGTGKAFGDCCGTLHAGARRAATCEQLMRARYSAHVVGDADFLLSTWDASVRPRVIEFDPALRWTGLEIVATTAGNLLDAEGTVDFIAHFEHGDDDTRGFHQEHSRFVRNDKRWVYLDAR
jgi:SEC-C motif domain protein